MTDPLDWRDLTRYLAGECTPEEARAFEAWMQADPARRQHVEVARRLWRASEQPLAAPGRSEAEADWARVAVAIQPPRSQPSDREPKPGARPRRRVKRTRRVQRGVLRASVVAALVLLLAGGLWMAGLVPAGGSASSTDAEWREIVTERGERAKIQLADGTQVTLNVDSRLRLPRTFAADVRQVHLQGEAYFDVASDASRPFVVRADEATVEVRGTSFGVRSYPEDRAVEVAVTEGAVALRGASAGMQAAELGAGQLGVYGKAAAAITTRAVEVGRYVSWTDGQLVFEHAALPQVADRLARWYDLEVELKDPSLRALHLTATLKSTSVRDVMDIVAASLGIAYRIDGRRVILTERPARLRAPSSPSPTS